MDIIGCLPTEIALEIFKYLTPSDLGACCLVSKTWRYYANVDMLWKKICLREGVTLPIAIPYHQDSSIADPCDSQDASENQDDYLDLVSPWAYAFSFYALRRIKNWRENRKSVHIIATFDSTVVAVCETTLAYSDELGVIFVYDLSDRTRFIQTIDLVIEEPALGIGLTKDHLIVKQGDVFTIFSRNINYLLEGFLVPFDGSYVFTKQNYDSEIAFVRHAMIENAVCILYDSSLFIYSLQNSSMHRFKVESQSFLLHDNYRVYVGTGRQTVTGIDSKGSYIDLDLVPSSIVSIKSNKDIIVALVCAEFHSGRYYIFKVWSRKCPYTEFHTSRPFGLEVALQGSRFASVANDKFGQKVCVSLYDLDKKSHYDLDLNTVEPIAQAKIHFVGRDLLYVVTRKDWGAYDMGYLIDLKTMTNLYEVELDHTGVVSVDSKLAVYLNTEAIEIHYYNR